MINLTQPQVPLSCKQEQLQDISWCYFMFLFSLKHSSDPFTWLVFYRKLL